MKLDKWQEEILDQEGNIVLRSGRQVGKSTIIAIKASEYAVRHKGTSIMIISATERQAYLLFSKVLQYLHDNFKSHMKAGKDRPTKSEIKLKNGSIIRCLPTGLDGLGIRGYTIDLLIADEAAYIPTEVFHAITPALLTTGGKIILLSTPRGKSGYFYECFQNKDFKIFHINSMEIAKNREEPQRTFMLEFFEGEKRRMPKSAFKQEYEGEFISGMGQFIDDDQIKAAMTQPRTEHLQTKYYLGVDVARYGGDESTFEIVRKQDDNFIHVENIAMENTSGTDVYNKIIELDKAYKFKKIGIDTGGLGATLFDFLMKVRGMEERLVDMNNAKRVYERKDNMEKKARLLKEVMYYDFKTYLEQDRVKLLEDENIFFSIRSVMIEQTDAGEPKISGTYTHIIEGLIRAIRLAAEDKSLNLWAEWK